MSSEAVKLLFPGKVPSKRTFGGGTPSERKSSPLIFVEEGEQWEHECLSQSKG
jgi:hypothetical protein